MKLEIEHQIRQVRIIKNKHHAIFRKRAGEIEKRRLNDWVKLL